MKPVEPAGEGELVNFGEGQPQYTVLPARVLHDDHGTVRTRWDLSLDERRALLDGACIELEVLTFGQPIQPVRLTVEGTDGLIEVAREGE